MAYTESDLRPFVKAIVEEEGKINTTELICTLRERLVLDEKDLAPLENRNDDRFSQVVRNLVRYPANLDDNIVDSHGYLIDKKTSPATFFAKLKPSKNSERIPNEEIKERQIKRKRYIARKVNFESRNVENQLIGDAGERYVLDYERTRLTDLGATFNLLEEVVHTSKVFGDGAGYDILSKRNEQGDNLYIEVKTTKGDLNAPFFISKNELSFLEEYQGQAILYRVFNFNYDQNTGEIHQISYGQLTTNFSIDPLIYIVTPKIQLL